MKWYCVKCDNEILEAKNIKQENKQIICFCNHCNTDVIIKPIIIKASDK